MLRAGSWRKILVIRGGAIGDFIVTLPVLEALRTLDPMAHIELLGYPQVASLAKAAGLVQAVRAIESPSLAGFFARDACLDPEWRSYFAGFDLVLSYLYDPEGIFRGNVERCTMGLYLSGPHRPDETLDCHATESLLKPLESLGLHQLPAEPRLVINFERNGAASGDLWVACHPGSGSASKNWPETSWGMLLRKMMTETPWKILLVGGEAEGQRLEHLKIAILPGRGQVLSHAPLLQLAEALRACRAFVGHDSGISHLAAALGLPGLVLWGPSRQAVWRPRSPRVQVLHHINGLSSLTPDQVLAALGSLLFVDPVRILP